MTSSMTWIKYPLADRRETLGRCRRCGVPIEAQSWAPGSFYRSAWGTQTRCRCGVFLQVGRGEPAAGEIVATHEAAIARGATTLAREPAADSL